MLFNIFKLYFSKGIIEKQIVNRIFILSFLGYLFLYAIFKNVVIFIALFDGLYFINQIIDMKLYNRNIKNITIKENIQKTCPINDFKEYNKRTIIIDPEYKKEYFTPYKYDIKETIKQITGDS